MKRKCYQCSIEKNLEEFYRSKKEHLGREYLCKECSRIKGEKFRKDNHEHWLEKNQKYRDRKKLEDPEWTKKEYHKRKKSNAESQKRRRIKNRKKFNARANLNFHVQAGHIIRPEKCTKCDQICKVEGHHENYNLPLKVIWLCIPCHVKADKKRKQNE